MDKLVIEYKFLLEEEDQELEELAQLREIKDMRQKESKEYSDRLRHVKNELFNCQDKLN